MKPAEMAKLVRRLQDSMEASHRLHQELLGAFEQLLREEPSRPEPTPPTKTAATSKWAGPVYLDTQAAAERLGLSPRTLEQWRVRGGGPPFLKIGGGVRYQLADLDEWLASRRRKSTSDPGGGE